MITGTHAVIHTTDATGARAFFRDVLGLAAVDAGDGWLIFRMPPAELGIHPSDPSGAGTHELYLMCDDIAATVTDLTAAGGEFVGEVTDRGFGLMISLRIPGGGTLGLYEPRHPVAYDLEPVKSEEPPA